MRFIIKTFDGMFKTITDICVIIIIKCKTKSMFLSFYYNILFLMRSVAYSSDRYFRHTKSILLISNLLDDSLDN